MPVFLDFRRLEAEDVFAERIRSFSDAFQVDLRFLDLGRLGRLFGYLRGIQDVVQLVAGQRDGLILVLVEEPALRLRAGARGLDGGFAARLAEAGQLVAKLREVGPDGL